MARAGAGDGRDAANESALQSRLNGTPSARLYLERLERARRDLGRVSTRRYFGARTLALTAGRAASTFALQAASVRMLDLVAVQLLRKGASEFDPPSLARVAWAFAARPRRTGEEVPPLWGSGMSVVAEAAATDACRLSSKELANILWGLAVAALSLAARGLVDSLRKGGRVAANASRCGAPPASRRWPSHWRSRPLHGPS
eukprot:Hpha_TRINITY_DN13156_c0_g2::TRINITY_DN13156_c0_g2_i1::g.113438::m.113438